MDVLSTFVREKSVDPLIIQKYQDKLPPELIAIWREKGFGTLLNGYLKIINPEEYDQFIKDACFRDNHAVPIMATAFGDLIVWQDNKYVCIALYRYNQFNYMISGFPMYLRCLGDETFWKYHFAIEQYKEALEKNGTLAFDECFGYVPLLVLGGPESADHIRKVKMKEHIAIMAEFADRI